MKRFILFLILGIVVTHLSSAQEMNYIPGDTVTYQPGFFEWDENTVITTEDLPSGNIVQYQQILDHSNTSFGEHQESLILLSIDSIQAEPSGQFAYMIEISSDTIHVTASSDKLLTSALARLHRMKMDAVKSSPDYGLIYLRCGEYRTMNF